MRDAEIAELLRDRNPWWRGERGWPERDEILREAALAPFEYRPGVLEDLRPGGLYTLSGPRRVGKSLAARRAIEGLIGAGVPARSVLYASCDGFSAQQLRRLFRAGMSLTRGAEGPRWWFVDEITAVGAGWSSVVKDLRDDTPLRRDCVVLTGSSSRELREAAKSFAGRRGEAAERSDRLLLQIPFRDYCALIGVEGLPEIPPVAPADLCSTAARAAVEELSFWLNDLVDAWESYLRSGGFPRAVGDLLARGDVTPGFARDLWDVIRGEAIRATSLGEADLVSLLARLAQGLASPLNASAVGRDVGLSSHHAVGDRVNDLAFAFQVWRCHRTGAGGRPSTAAQRKVYFLDPLLARLAHVLNPAYPAPDVTKLSEQQIGLALARASADGRAERFVAGEAPMYERTATGREIDFVGPNQVPMESKYVERSWRQEARTLAAAHGRGILATRNVLDTDGAVWAVPACILAWLLGH
jgi:uncharacterized protein